MKNVTKSGAKKIALEAILLIPRFVQLMYRLIKDREVKKRDKAICAACIGYIFMPFDIIPDFIPFLGQLDDIFILALGVRRLMKSAGREKIEKYWTGDKNVIALAESILDAATRFLSPASFKKLENLFRSFEKEDPKNFIKGIEEAEIIDLEPESYEKRGFD